MKSEKTAVDTAKFQSIVSRLGIPIEPKAAWVKVCGPKGRAVYVPKSALARRVDVSGFEVSMPGVRDLGELSFGSVRQELDFTLPEDEILAAFEAVCEHMMTLPERKVIRGARKGASQAKGWDLAGASSPASPAPGRATLVSTQLPATGPTDAE